MDGHRLACPFAAGADDAQRDFATVGDQDLVEHGRRLAYSMIISGAPNSTGRHPRPGCA
jgi:hypothetical protein